MKKGTELERRRYLILCIGDGDTDSKKNADLETSCPVLSLAFFATTLIVPKWSRLEYENEGERTSFSFQ